MCRRIECAFYLLRANTVITIDIRYNFSFAIIEMCEYIIFITKYFLFETAIPGKFQSIENPKYLIKMM